MLRSEQLKYSHESMQISDKEIAFIYVHSGKRGIPSCQFFVRVDEFVPR